MNVNGINSQQQISKPVVENVKSSANHSVYEEVKKSNESLKDTSHSAVSVQKESVGKNINKLA